MIEKAVQSLRLHRLSFPASATAQVALQHCSIL